jgi:hypothetical protein
MLIGRIEELPGTVVHVIGKSQGYLGLPVRYEVMLDATDGSEVMTMTTAWFPTPKELDDLNAGKAIYLNLFGGSHPPVRLSTGPASEHESEAKQAARVALLELALQEWDILRQKFIDNGRDNPTRSMDILLKSAIDRYFGSAEHAG